MFAKLAPLSFKTGSEYEDPGARSRGAIVGLARAAASGSTTERQRGMSLLDFYRNRSERVLSARERQELEKAKAALRAVATEPRR